MSFTLRQPKYLSAIIPVYNEEENKPLLHEALSRGWVAAIVSLLVLLSVVVVGGADGAKAAGSHPSTKKTVTVWIQVTDSCKQALSGATFTVAGNGINTTTSPTTGTTPRGVPNPTSGCPTQRGSCVNFSTGCTTAVLNVPASGTLIYTITIAKTAPGQGTNASYAWCEGGSDCPHGPEVATVKVSSGGAVSATVLNIYPDGTLNPWPVGRAAWSAAQGDPMEFHEFGIAAKSTSSNQCDGDFDKDDFLTGIGHSVHCDSDKGTPGS